MSAKPTREELVALLFSDPASEAWEHDATWILDVLAEKRTFYRDEPGVLGACKEIAQVVSAELDLHMALGHEDEREDLEDVACGAILLLVAAWAAERAAGKPVCDGSLGASWAEGSEEDLVGAVDLEVDEDGCAEIVAVDGRELKTP